MSLDEPNSPEDLGADDLHRLLIVDDNRDFVDMLSAGLTNNGHEVETASSCRDAREAIETFDAQLAVIDLYLSDGAGIELMATLKERRPDLLCVAVTGQADLGIAVETMRAGFDDFLVKPVTRIELYAALERASSKLALIRQRQAAEAALREGETRFGAVCEASPAPIIITRVSDDTVIFANDACARLLGISREDLVGFHAPDMWHDSAEREVLVEQLKRHGSVRRLETRLKSADSSIRWVLGWSELRAIDGEAVVVSGLNDITERKQAERDAARAHARLMDAIECIPNGFTLYDADGRLVLCNEHREVYPRHGDVFEPGSTFEDVLRDGVERGEFPTAIGREEEWISERLRTHADPSGPIEQELMDGRWLRIEERRTSEGGIVGLRTDITEIKRAERQAADANARLNDAIESIAEGFVLYDADERLVLCNSKYCDVYPVMSDFMVPGVRLEEVIRAGAEHGATVLEFDDIDAWVRLRLEEYRSGTGSREFHLPDGRWILASERRMRDGGIVGLRMDITARKEAEQSVAEAGSRLSDAIESISDGLILYDADERLVLCNRKYRELYPDFGENLVPGVRLVYRF